MPRAATFPGPKCKIWWDVNVKCYHISTPYNPEFITTLKQLIPASDREFQPDKKIWVISERFFEPVRKLSQAIWPGTGSVHVIDREAAERTALPTSVDKRPVEDICADFVKALPFEAAQSAYRKAATMFHPDVDPSGADKMMKLNVLWDRIQKEVYKR